MDREGCERQPVRKASSRRTMSSCEGRHEDRKAGILAFTSWNFANSSIFSDRSWFFFLSPANTEIVGEAYPSFLPPFLSLAP
jgi:hypothetical protein